MKISNYISVAAKGFLMGAANVIPGVSGGTMAVLTGIFHKIIACLSCLGDVSTYKLLFTGKFREFWKKIDGGFLVALAIGILVSIFTLAKVLGYTMSTFPVETWAFFFGLIVASAAVMLFDIKGWKVMDVVLCAVGIALGVGVCMLSPTQTPDSLWFIAICGAVGVCSMILPGISGSFMLLVLGKYHYIMIEAVNNLNLVVLGTFAVGGIIGIIAFAKLLNWVLSKWERGTMLILTGFIIGSLVKIWPWSNMYDIAVSQNLAPALEKGQVAPVLDSGVLSAIDLHIGSAVIFALAGLACVALIEYFSRKSK